MSGSTHHPSYRIFLEILRGARKRQGISQVELASRLGNTQTFVSKYERGERRIDLVEFVEIADALALGPDELLAEFLKKDPQQRSSGRKLTAPSSKFYPRFASNHYYSVTDIIIDRPLQ